MSRTVRLSVDVAADPAAACEVIRNWADWPRAFPATIESVRLLKETGDSVTLQVLHKFDGVVINILRPDEGGAVRLGEFKPRYDAQFTFFASPAEPGSTLHVHGCIWLKGRLAWLGCLAGPLIRSRMRRYLLEPIRMRAKQLERAPSAPALQSA